MFSAWSAMFAAPSATASAYPAQYPNGGSAPHAPPMPSQSILGSYTSTPPHNLHSPYTSTGNNNAGPRNNSMHGSNQRGGFRGAQNRPNGNHRPNNNKQHNNNSANSNSPNKNDDLNSNNKRPRSPGHSPPRKKEKKEKKEGGGGGMEGMPSLSSISLPADDPADIAAWIAERKKRFPTAAVVAAKQAAHESAVARGEITEDKRKGKGKGGKFQKGPRGNNPQQQQQQQQRGGGSGNRPHGRGGNNSSLYVLGRDNGAEERSDVEDEPSSDEEGEDAAQTNGKAAAPAMAPLSSESPNWKRRLCQWEQPGMKGCRKPASQCSFLHRGEVPPPRHPNAAKVTHHSTILSNPAAPTTITSAGESQSAASTAADSTIVPSSTAGDAEMTAATEESASKTSIDPSNPSTATSTVAIPVSTDVLAPVEPAAVPTAEASQPANSSASQPAKEPSHPITTLSAVTIDRLLQSIRFLVRSGPLRVKVEEPADSSEEDQ